MLPGRPHSKTGLMRENLDFQLLRTVPEGEIMFTTRQVLEIQTRLTAPEDPGGAEQPALAGCSGLFSNLPVGAAARWDRLPRGSRLHQGVPVLPGLLDDRANILRQDVACVSQAGPESSTFFK